MPETRQSLEELDLHSLLGCRVGRQEVGWKNRKERGRCSEEMEGRQRVGCGRELKRGCWSGVDER